MCKDNKNLDVRSVCQTCRLRKNSARLDETTLCVLHATTQGSYTKSRNSGFIITKDPKEGRSVGDLIYTYTYSGDLQGSIGHGINLCWSSEGKEKGFTVFQIKFSFDFDQVVVFDQEAWTALRDKKYSNYDALKKLNGSKLADKAKWMKQQARSANSRTFDPNDVRLDDITDAARALGARAIYALGLGGNMLLFFYPQDMSAGQVWIDEPAPTTIHESNLLVTRMNRLTAPLWEEFVTPPPQVPGVPLEVRLGEPSLSPRADNIRRGLVSQGETDDVDRRARDLSTRHPGLRYLK